MRPGIAPLPKMPPHSSESTCRKIIGYGAATVFLVIALFALVACLFSLFSLAARFRSPVQHKPPLHTGIQFNWTLHAPDPPQTCEVSTVSVNPNNATRLRVDNTHVECVNPRTYFRFPRGWRIGDEPTSLFVPSFSDNIRKLRVQSNPLLDNVYVFVPDLGAPYWAIWNETNFQIVVDDQVESPK